MSARTRGDVIDGGGAEPDIHERVAQAAAACTEGASPLPETDYKVAPIEATVAETLQRRRDARRVPQFLIRRRAWYVLDHALQLEDRDDDPSDVHRAV
ncbi:MAG: hypothetical protein AAFP84_09700 [Actinomycetota bacterium]